MTGHYHSFFNLFFRILKANKKAEALVRYSVKGRCGFIICSYNNQELSFYFEYSGGNNLAVIWIPTPENWEKETGLPLTERENVIHFVGRQVVADQVSPGKGYYTVENGFMYIKETGG